MSLFNNRLQKVQLSMLDTDVQQKFTSTDAQLRIKDKNRISLYQKISALNNSHGKVCYVGDSITYNGWFTPLTTLFPNATHINKGIGGNTTLDVINRLSDITSTGANLYILAIGINDSRYNDSRGATTQSAYIANVTTIINALKAAGGDVVIVSIWPHFFWDQFANLGYVGTNIRMVQWNTALSKYCSDNSIPFIDAYSEIIRIIDLENVGRFTKTDGSGNPDGVHPNPTNGTNLYSDAVLYGNVKREEYDSSAVQASGNYLYKLEILSTNDPTGYVILENLAPNPAPNTNEWYGTSGNLSYNNLSNLFTAGTGDTFNGYANLHNDFPLTIIWNSTNPLESLNFTPTLATKAIKNFILYESIDKSALANPNHSSWRVIAKELTQTKAYTSMCLYNRGKEPIGKAYYLLKVLSSDGTDGTGGTTGTYVKINKVTTDAAPIMEYKSDSMTAGNDHIEDVFSSAGFSAGIANIANTFPFNLAFSTLYDANTLTFTCPGAGLGRNIKGWQLFRSYNENALNNFSDPTWVQISSGTQPTNTAQLVINLPTNTPSIVSQVDVTQVTSIQVSNWTKVRLDTVSLDTNNEFDATTNYRFTAKSNGRFAVKAAVGWTNNQVGTRNIVAVYKNGSSFRTLSDTRAGAAGTAVTGGSVDISLNVNDFIEIYAYTDYQQGTDNNAQKTWLSITQLVKS